MASLQGNDKRKASCKAVGSEKKKTGHAREDIFGARFCDPTATTYKAEADKVITNADLMAQLRASIGPIAGGGVSIKGGNNLQFTLGRIPEISETADKSVVLKDPAMWERYLGKSMSNTRAEILCYKTETGWIFFNMTRVIEYIVTCCTWRELGSGRMKGDFVDDSARGSRQYLTYEYRNTHRSHFLGANGNKGRAFISLLRSKIPFLEVADI